MKKIADDGRRRGHSVAGVAFACGFGDLSHFYRVFKTRFGHPPGQWLTVRCQKRGGDS